MCNLYRLSNFDGLCCIKYQSLCGIVPLFLKIRLSAAEPCVQTSRSSHIAEKLPHDHGERYILLPWEFVTRILHNMVLTQPSG
jgi:hypothetical protein